MKNYLNASNKPHIIVVSGPTAVGKTETTIRLANALDAEIISADSMQIYRDLNIGTAKPTAEELARAPHHLVDFVSPFVPYSVAQYAAAARDCINAIIGRGKAVIVTGGTGLYIHSLLYKMDFSEVRANPEIRRELDAILEHSGALQLHAMLKERDPATAERIHPNNVRKVQRALEILFEKGSIDTFKSDPVAETAYRTQLFILNRERAELYDRINMRVDLMLQSGLIDEVRHLLKMGLTAEHQAMQGIGYKEVIRHINGELTAAELGALLKQNTRRYAKRQLTWFRRYQNAQWIDITIRKNADSVVEYIMENIKGGQNEIID